jgi:hypothetical protein
MTRTKVGLFLCVRCMRMRAIAACVLCSDGGERALRLIEVRSEVDLLCAQHGGVLGEVGQLLVALPHQRLNLSQSERARGHES